MQRWMRPGCFERLVEDTRILLREFAARKRQPTAVCTALGGREKLRLGRQIPPPRTRL
jgi:hypothetical protein